MEEHKVKVINWIKSGMNYEEGVSMIIKLSGRQGFLNQFKGKENKLKDKLVYELCKVSKLGNHKDWKKIIENVENYGSQTFEKRIGNISVNESPKRSREKINSIRTTINEDGENEFDEKIIYPGLSDEYPVIIHRVMNDMGDLYQQRSILHGKMVNMDESNKRILVKERVRLFDQIKKENSGRIQ